jgi:dTDP-4-amino-4,6-dideoxygalactose transaminase
MERRRKLAKNYMDLIGDTNRYQRTIRDGVHSYQSFCVFVDDNKMARRRLLERGIETQVGSYALHLQPAFANCKREGTFENSTWLNDHVLALPMYHTLAENKQAEVVEALKRVW